jgi:hypothetical protein
MRTRSDMEVRGSHGGGEGAAKLFSRILTKTGQFGDKKPPG